MTREQIEALMAQIDQAIEANVIGGTDDHPAVNRAGVLGDIASILEKAPALALKALDAEGSGVVEAEALIRAERQRQISQEGWTPEHDDAHTDGSLLRAGVIYLHCDPANPGATPLQSDGTPLGWPWDEKWWKPKDRRSNLIRAGALCLAEVERLARAGRATLHAVSKFNLAVAKLSALARPASEVKGEPVVTFEITKLGSSGGHALSDPRPREWWHKLPVGTYALYASPPADSGGLPYAEVIRIVNNCVERMRQAGESHAMLAKWISEGINAAISNRTALKGAPDARG